MNKLRTLHNEAMNYADLAFVAKFEGDLDTFNENSLKAYELEAQAADGYRFDFSAEPTRSVLYRSAAALAIDCKKYPEAVRLIELGLGGNPPTKIAEQLRELLEQANFYHHLQLKGIALASNELQFVMTGNNVGDGMTLSEHFIVRIQSIQNLFNRTVERLTKKPYKDRSDFSKSSRPFNLLLSAPRKGSFAITLRVAEPEQLVMPGFEEEFILTSQEVIEEVLECIDLFNGAKEEELKNRITDEAYYRNFVGLAKNLAPDGDAIKTVGFTLSSANKFSNDYDVKDTVRLTRIQKDISLIPRSQLKEKDRKEVVKVKGQLLYANSQSPSNRTIRVVEKNGHSTTVIVLEGMMSDIVRPLWEQYVEITGTKHRSNSIKLIDIRQINLEEALQDEPLDLPDTNAIQKTF